jgi:hypothetical protein
MVRRFRQAVLANAGPMPPEFNHSRIAGPIAPSAPIALFIGDWSVSPQRDPRWNLFAENSEYSSRRSFREPEPPAAILPLSSLLPKKLESRATPL